MLMAATLQFRLATIRYYVTLRRLPAMLPQHAATCHCRRARTRTRADTAQRFDAVYEALEYAHAIIAAGAIIAVSCRFFMRLCCLPCRQPCRVTPIMMFILLR